MQRPILVVLLIAAAVTQDAGTLAQGPILSAPPPASVARPFRLGERFTYEASFGIVPIGHANIELGGTDTVRDRTAWRATLTLTGGTLFFKVRDSTVSWFDTRTLSSLRFVQHLREGSFKADRDYQIFPERATYIKNDEPETQSVAEPLDDMSFLYFIRTIPLQVGQQYEFSRYFQPSGNPVVIRVLRKERVTVPAGVFNTIVVQPLIASPGLFSSKERAEVWISDDNARIIVQLKSRLRFGSLKLALKKYTPGSVADVMVGEKLK